MKYTKQIKKFIFQLPHDEIAQQIDDDYPITLKYNENLVDRVHSRYPFVSKKDVILVITAVFQIMRKVLILGDIINFHHLFFDVKFLFYFIIKNKKLTKNLKLKIKTPPGIKKETHG